jgi:DNA repair photolyase
MDQLVFPTKETPERKMMNRKPVYEVPAKSVINFASGFGHKLLCDGLTFSTGSACAYSCAFCYVPDLMRKSPHLAGIKERHDQVVIRRRGAIEAMRRQLTDRFGCPKFQDPKDSRVIYSSPLVDVAANMELVRETIDACKTILELTHWHIRLLSKSNLLPKIAEGISPMYHPRLVFGVSTGTLDDKLARSFEQGTPLPSKRIESLHWLQDNGFRTFGMICPSLPQRDYDLFAAEMCNAIRAERCEHVWAEVINVRGDSMTRTISALRAGGFDWEADALNETRNRATWEEYARRTFLAHANIYCAHLGGKLRFLQYVTSDTHAWWKSRENLGSISL